MLLFEALWAAVDTISLGNKSAASDVALRDQSSGFEDHQAAFFEASSQAPPWSVNKKCLKSQTDKCPLALCWVLWELEKKGEEVMEA